MNKYPLFLLFTFSIGTYCQQKNEVSKAIIPQTVKFAGKEIKLNGVGYRTKLWFDICTQALYLNEFSSNPEEIMNSNSTMGMIFNKTSPLVTAKNLTKI